MSDARSGGDAGDRGAPSSRIGDGDGAPRGGEGAGGGRATGRPAARTGTGVGPRAVPADDPHRRPQGVDDATVEAVGRVTEALEWVERARGRLYDFHQMIGRADALLGDAADALAGAGHAGQARRLREEIIGRNVLEGRWTFQVVEEFDATYWQPLRDAEQGVRDALVDGRPHVHEAELKAARLSWGRRHHEWDPGRS